MANESIARRHLTSLVYRLSESKFLSHLVNSLECNSCRSLRMCSLPIYLIFCLVLIISINELTVPPSSILFHSFMLFPADHLHPPPYPRLKSRYSFKVLFSTSLLRICSVTLHTR